MSKTRLVKKSCALPPHAWAKLQAMADERATTPSQVIRDIVMPVLNQDQQLELGGINQKKGKRK